MLLDGSNFQGLSTIGHDMHAGVIKYGLNSLQCADTMRVVKTKNNLIIQTQSEEWSDQKQNIPRTLSSIYLLMRYNLVGRLVLVVIVAPKLHSPPVPFMVGGFVWESSSRHNYYCTKIKWGEVFWTELNNTANDEQQPHLIEGEGYVLIFSCLPLIHSNNVIIINSHSQGGVKW